MTTQRLFLRRDTVALDAYAMCLDTSDGPSCGESRNSSMFLGWLGPEEACALVASGAAYWEAGSEPEDLCPHCGRPMPREPAP